MKLILPVFQDSLQKFVPSLGGQISGQMINLGGHFLSKDSGQLHFVGLYPGGAPVPPPKPGSKGVGGSAGGAGGAGGSSEGDQAGDREGGASSSLKGRYHFIHLHFHHFYLFLFLQPTMGPLLPSHGSKRISACRRYDTLFKRQLFKCDSSCCDKGGVRELVFVLLKEDKARKTSCHPTCPPGKKP